MSSLAGASQGVRDQPASAAGERPAAGAGRLFFIDNIRVFLTVLVILHHLMVIYAGSGGWIYQEDRQDDITAVLGGWFCGVNQAYFMGLFLLISAYFVPGSYDRKGAGAFMKDRLIRLGIPLVFYGWILRPGLIYLGLMGPAKPALSFWDWYTQVYFRVYGIIGGGPLWFIETLLIFSAVYVLWRLLTRSRSAPPPAPPVRETPFPSPLAIALGALLLGIATFAVRLFFPSGSSVRSAEPAARQFRRVRRLFILGLIAYRRNWLLNLPGSTGRLCLWTALVLILLYPVVAILGGAMESTEPFDGGWHWQALANAIWEAAMSLAMSTGLIYLFRQRGNWHGALARLLARHAYTAYLIHEPVITVLAIAAAGIALYPLLKFGLAALVFVPLCFALSVLVLKIPGADRVL